MDKCPLCGYSEVRASRKEHNIMNQYVNPDNPSKGSFTKNSIEEQITIGEVTFLRADLWKKGKTVQKPSAPVVPVTQVPVVPETQQVAQTSNPPPSPNTAQSAPPVEVVPHPAVASGWPVSPQQP